jgi:hypoxanthine phosphoribosyltransferase
MSLPPSITEVYAGATLLYPKEEVEQALDDIAKKMNNELAEANPLFLCVLIGGIVPIGNLLPRLSFPLEVDYIHVTRYQNALTGNEIEWRAKPKTRRGKSLYCRFG